MRRSLHRAVSGLTVAIGLGAGLTPAGAGVPSDALQRLDAAVAKFEALKAKTQAEGRPPLLSKPDERSVLDALWDAPALLGRPPFTRSDLLSLSKITQAEIGVMTTYVSPDGGPPKEALMERYFDEIVHTAAIEIVAMADLQPALADLWRTLKPEQITEDRKAGLRQVRTGIGVCIDGLVTILGSDAPEADKRLLSQAMAAGAANLAATLRPAQRKVYIEEAQATLPKVPEALKPDLQTFIDAMSSATCVDLCTVQ